MSTAHGITLPAMSGLHPQSRRKREKRSVDMSQQTVGSLQPWIRPPPDECEEDDPLTIYPTGANPSEHRVKIRIVSHLRSRAIIEFALIQQTYDRGRWRDVVAVDSCHDRDVHLHRYSRATDARIGEPDPLIPITCETDVQEGYNLGYEMVERSWSANYQRWHDA